MATLHTPNLGLPYPDEQSPADVPTDLTALALALDTLGNLFTPGDLKVSAAPNPPAGWLLCDGSAVSRTQYAKLYATIGVAFGAGDGVNTFTLPDYRGRTILGAGAGAGLTARALGGKGGEEAHALAVGELPSHDHGGATGADSPDHTHSGSTGVDSPDHGHVPGDGSVFLTAGGSVTGQTVTGGAGGTLKADAGATGGATARHAHAFGTGGASARHAHSVGAQGGGGTHNNMPPYAVANVFIKT